MDSGRLLHEGLQEWLGRQLELGDLDGSVEPITAIASARIRFDVSREQFGSCWNKAPAAAMAAHPCRGALF